MKKSAIAILISFLSIAAYCQQGYKQVLNNVATITFPDTPKTVKKNGINVYTYTRSGIVFLAEGTPFRKNLKELFTSHLNDSLYSEVITGSLNSTKGKLIYRKNIKSKGVDGIDFCYTAVINSKTYYMYHQAFCFSNTLILYGYWSPDSLRSDDKNVKAFFETFKVTLSAEELKKGDTPAAYHLGQLVGRFIGRAFVILLIGAFGFGVVVLIRKITN